jgi:hypothetical protein
MINPLYSIILYIKCASIFGENKSVEYKPPHTTKDVTFGMTKAITIACTTKDIATIFATITGMTEDV